MCLLPHLRVTQAMHSALWVSCCPLTCAAMHGGVQAATQQLKEQYQDELAAQARLVRAKEVENQYILSKLRAKYDREAALHHT